MLSGLKGMLRSIQLLRHHVKREEINNNGVKIGLGTHAICRH